MAKTNTWLEFIKEYRKKYPNLKYGDVLEKASKSPEWIRYKKKYSYRPKKKCDKGQNCKCDKKNKKEYNKYSNTELIEEIMKLKEQVKNIK